MSRPDWDEYFMEITEKVAQRSTCPRAKMGAVITNNREIISTGYNGSPSGMEECIDIGCLMIDGHCERTVHAEQNALLYSDRADRKGGTIYINKTPCIICQRMIVQSGIKRVIMLEQYREYGMMFVDKANLEWRYMS